MEETKPAADATPAAPASLPETVTVNTQHGHVVVLKGYATGGDMDEMQRLIMADRTVQVDRKTGKVIRDGNLEMAATAGADREKKAIELLTISVDGKTENVVQLVRDLPYQDYEEVTERLNDITAPLVKTESPSSESDTTKPS